MDATRGHCLCGRTTFEFSGPVMWCGHCHCESCRRATASPFTTWVGVQRGNCRFSGEPRVHVSSPGVRRYFCAHCGSPIAFDSDRYLEEIHVYAALLENPASVAPQFHVHVGEELPWIVLADGLPQYERSKY